MNPPELGDLVRDTDKEPYWIPGAFPTIFQNETGDPHNAPLKEVDLEKWGPHILRPKGWRAQAHVTFMYWFFNMVQRWKALSAKNWCVRDNPKATGCTAQDLKTMSMPMLAKRMVGYTAQIPGTSASKARVRRVMLAMVRQMEIETGGGARYAGDIPCIFGTLTSQRYHWDEIIRLIAQVEGIPDYKGLSRSKRRELVNRYPATTAFLVCVRMELVLKTVVVPILGASAYMAVPEWSPTGGMARFHYVIWKPGAPRFDLRAERLQRTMKEARKRAGQLHVGLTGRHTRCTSTAQEEQSAFPAGVLNRYEDSSDDEAYGGEQKEIAKEVQELLGVNSLGVDVDLRLNWADVQAKLAMQSLAGGSLPGCTPTRLGRASAAAEPALCPVERGRCGTREPRRKVICRSEENATARGERPQ